MDGWMDGWTEDERHRTRLIRETLQLMAGGCVMKEENWETTDRGENIRTSYMNDTEESNWG